MDPSRKRKVRLVVALTAALLLAGTLVFVSFGSSTEAKTPSQVLAAGSGASYEMTGKVVGPVTGNAHEGGLRFTLRDVTGTKTVPVVYVGSVPDLFKVGREVMLKGALANGTFVAEKDSLVTKCPSKFKNDKSGDSV